MSTAKFDTLSNLDGSQSVPVATVAQGSAKAWVNFNGTGTVAIRAAFNVTSITDNGAGDYTLNFTTAFADTNYAATTGVASYTADTTTTTGQGLQSASVTTSSIRLITGATSSSSKVDNPLVCVAIFR